MATRNLLVRAGFDASGMRSGTRQANTYLSNFGTNANRSMSNLSGTVSSTMGKIGKIIAGAFAIGAIVNFGKQCVELGSNLSEVQNVVDVTFGSLAEEVNDFAKSAITSFGLSETSAKKYTSTMGAMLKSMGMTTNQALNMSKTITGLSADMASFYNLDADEAFSKIRAGISGETEPLKQLGINMSVANLEAYRLSQGIGTAYSKMSQAEQTMLRYNYLLKVTADAQGDFARTSDSWANQTRILTEQFNALKAEIGQGLIAALTPVVKGLNSLISKLQVAASYFRGFMELIFGKQAVSGGSGIAGLSDSTDALTDSADGASDSVSGIGDAAKEAGKKAKGALASFDELNTLSKSSDSSSGSSDGSSVSIGNVLNTDLGSVDTTTTALDGISVILEELVGKFASINMGPLIESLNRFKEALAPITEQLFSGLKWGIDNVIFPLTQWTIESLLPAFFNLLSGALTVLNPLIEAFKPLALFLWENFLQPIASWTGGVIVSVLNGLASSLKKVGDWMSENTSIVTGITTALVAFFAAWKLTELMAFIQISGGIASAVTAITAAIKAGTVAKLADKVQTIALTALYAKDFIVSIAKSTAAFVKQTAALVAGKVAQLALTTATVAWNVAAGIGAAVTTAFGTAIAILTSPITLVIAAIAALVAGIVLLIKNWDTVKEVGAKCWEGIKTAWTGASQWFSTTIIDPIAKAFDAMWNGIKSTCSSVFNGIKNVVKTPLNYVIDMINSVIGGLNKLSIDIPDWVPGFGGQSWGVNISKIPKLAKGGVVDSPTVAMIGEAGKEAVVPLENNTEWASNVASVIANSLMPFIGAGSSGQNVSLEMDGTVMARSMTPYIIKEMKRLGFDF